MNILYLAPRTKREFVDKEGEKLIFDFKETLDIINLNLQEKFPDDSITIFADLIDTGTSPDEVLNSYDIVLCDITTMNSNVLFYAGKAEALDKPVIYFKDKLSSYPVVLESRAILNHSKATLDNEFLEELNETIKMVKVNPDFIKHRLTNQKNRPKAFVSYSHHDDKIYIDRLKVHLKPLIRKGEIDIWIDTKIKTGDDWQREIETALSDASVAILMVSADFMSSDFIIDNELPPLLSKAEVQGTKILPVIVSPCRFSRDKELSRFQAANPPDKPLSSMTTNERENIYDSLMRDIEASIDESR